MKMSVFSRAGLIRLWAARRGATAIEYGVIAAGVGVAISGAVFVMGGDVAALFGSSGTALTDAREGGALPLVARNTFEDGREGWSGGTPRTLAQIGTGLSLARDEALGNGIQTVSRSFDLPADAARAEIGFDMSFVDSWDDEQAVIYVNGKRVGTGSFRWNGTEPPQLEFTPSPGMTASAELTSRVQAGSWSDLSRGTDHTYAVRLSVENPGERLTLGFGTTLNQSQEDESLLIGNVEVRAGGNAAADPDPAPDPPVRLIDRGPSRVNPGDPERPTNRGAAQRVP